LCHMCPGYKTFTSSHLACFNFLIRRIPARPSLIPSELNSLQQLQNQHDYQGIWTLHQHIGNSLIYEQRVPIHPHAVLVDKFHYSTEVLFQEFGTDQFFETSGTAYITSRYG
ncbi:hypothetical protein SARC_03498, partial [Sphaeroforma arctica JP610]